jgi:hypothetical protein
MLLEILLSCNLAGIKTLFQVQTLVGGVIWRKLAFSHSWRVPIGISAFVDAHNVTRLQDDWFPRVCLVLYANFPYEVQCCSYSKSNF